MMNNDTKNGFNLCCEMVIKKIDRLMIEKNLSPELICSVLLDLKNEILSECMK